MSERGKVQSMEEEEIRRLFLGIMEGYNDPVIPPLSYFSPTHETPTISSKRQKLSEVSSIENLNKERKRREHMSEKFSVLRSNLPTLLNESKPSKEKILGLGVDYIKFLQEEIKRLEGLMKLGCKEKIEEKPIILKCTDQNSIKVSVSNGATFIAIQRPSRRGLVPDALKVLQKHRAEVVEARVCVNDERLLTFTATVRIGSDGGSSATIDKIRKDLLTL